MQRGVWIAVVAMLGCAPEAQDPGCDDHTDSFFRFDVHDSEAEPLPTELRGWNTQWAPDVQIQGKDDLYGFALLREGGEPLEAPREGLYDITARGFDPPMGDEFEPALMLADADSGEPVWLGGNIELLEPLGGWTVESPRDKETCRTWAGESGKYRNKPVTFTSPDGNEAVLFTHEEAEVDGYVLTVSAAQSNTRDHPFAPCEEPDCPWEKLSWTIVAVD